MARPIFTVDSFASEAFAGNPAAVCILETEASPSWMQAVAAEMNLSETAFVLARGGNEFSIRWFTPSVEVPLCGHATLASAHTLWEEGQVPRDEKITFHGQQGVLTACREADWICMDFPALPVEPIAIPEGLSEALGATPTSTHRNSLGIFLAELESEEVVRKLEPDLTRLLGEALDACIVTARADSDACDFISRFFAPAFGINEDPVTGAAHCSLAPYWANRVGKSELVGHQVSKRGGVVRVRVRGARVDLLGRAVTIMRGEVLR